MVDVVEKALHLDEIGPVFPARQALGITDIDRGQPAETRRANQVLELLDCGEKGLLESGHHHAAGRRTCRLQPLDVLDACCRRFLHPDVGACCKRVERQIGRLHPAIGMIGSDEEDQVRLFPHEHLAVVGIGFAGAEEPGEFLCTAEIEIA